uniref:Si:ch73-335m24.2 n=1 Tax=Callorhinchus milii TaxID=7868 RepID=A0A4W3H7X3_CALMI
QVRFSHHHIPPLPPPLHSPDNPLSVDLQKVFDECQEQRSCQLSVNSRVFGLDPYGHKRKAVCENEKLRLHCKNHTILVIYSASFGRSPNGNVDCPSINSSAPDIECLSSTALRQLSMRCHGKPNCTVIANVLSFGNPCFPGVRKQLKVAYACGKKNSHLTDRKAAIVPLRKVKDRLDVHRLSPLVGKCQRNQKI